MTKIVCRPDWRSDPEHRADAELDKRLADFLKPPTTEEIRAACLEAMRRVILPDGERMYNCGPSKPLRDLHPSKRPAGAK